MRPIARLVTATVLLVLAHASAGDAEAQPGCPAGFNDPPALGQHLNQDDIANGTVPFAEVFNSGRQLFITNFNKCDGAGRPGNTASVAQHGVGSSRTPDPLRGPRFTI